MSLGNVKRRNNLTKNSAIILQTDIYKIMFQRQRNVLIVKSKFGTDYGIIFIKEYSKFLKCVKYYHISC